MNKSAHRNVLLRYAPPGFRAVWVAYPNEGGVRTGSNFWQTNAFCLADLNESLEPLCIFVIPPVPPVANCYSALISYSKESEEFASSQSRLISEGHRIVVVDPFALETEETAHLEPLDCEDQKQGQLLVDLATHGLELCGRDWRYPLPINGWELENADLSSEELTQAPGGEVFVHFECQWTGPIDVEFLFEGRLAECRLALEKGKIVGALNLPAGFESRIAGMSITEIGLGTNRNVKRSAVSWGEKAAGSIHIGIGPRTLGDTAPPQVHFDILLAADVQLKALGSEDE